MNLSEEKALARLLAVTLRNVQECDMCGHIASLPTISVQHTSEAKGLIICQSCWNQLRREEYAQQQRKFNRITIRTESEKKEAEAAYI